MQQPATCNLQVVFRNMERQLNFSSFLLNLHKSMLKAKDSTEDEARALLEQLPVSSGTDVLCADVLRV